MPSFSASFPDNWWLSIVICQKQKPHNVRGFPWWLSGKEPACQCRRCGFDAWFRKIPWRRKQHPTLLFLPGKPHGQKTLVGYSPWGRTEYTVYCILSPCLFNLYVEFSSVQLLSHVWLFVTTWTTACQPSLSITNSQSLPKLISIELVTPSNHLILCHPLLLLPSTFPNTRVF